MTRLLQVNGVWIALLGAFACESRGEESSETAPTGSEPPVAPASTDGIPAIAPTRDPVQTESTGPAVVGTPGVTNEPTASGGSNTAGANTGGSPSLGATGTNSGAQGGGLQGNASEVAGGGTSGTASSGSSADAPASAGGTEASAGTRGSDGEGGSSGEQGSGGEQGVGGEVVFDPDLPDYDGVGRWHHVHLNTLSPELSVEFYTRWFASAAAEYGGVPALWTQRSWVLLERVASPPPKEIVSSIYHIGWTVLDIDSTYDSMVAAGVSFDTPITDISTVFGGGGGVDFAYAEGPDGELIEFYNANVAEFMHLHFVADDPVTSGEWYQAHFGAQRSGASPSREPGFVDGRQIRPNMNVRFDAVTVWWYPTGFASATYPELWQGRSALEPQRGRAIDHFALSVNNLPQALAALEAASVEVLEPPAWRVNGAFISAFVRAPDGVELELVQGHAQME